MPFAADSIWVNVSTSGLADFTMTTALAGYQNFVDAGVPNGATIHYTARTATQFENGEGVYNSGTGVVTRVTIFESSTAGAKVTFGSSPTLAISPLAEDAIFPPASSTNNALALWDGTLGDLLKELAGVAIGNALLSGGVSTIPSWGKIGLTTHVSGVLPIANGGTGAGAIPVPTTITIANEATDTTCFPLFATAATGDLGPKSNANLTFNSVTGEMTNPIQSGGSGAASTLTLQSTSGVGTTDAILFKTGSQAEGWRMNTTGNLLGAARNINITEAVGDATDYWPDGGRVNIARTNLRAMQLAAFVNDNLGPRLEFAKSRGATLGSMTAVALDDELLRITAWGANGSAWNRAGYFSFFADGAISGGGATDMPGRAEIWLSPDGTATPVSKFRFQSNGFATIGAGTAATSMLHVAGPIATTSTSVGGTTYTVLSTDSSLLITSGSTLTLTLPAGNTCPGRWLTLHTEGAVAVNSASSNIKLLTGGAAQATILPATAGAWAILQAEGSGNQWIICAKGT